MKDIFNYIIMALIPPWDGDPIKVRHFHVAIAVSIYVLFVAAVWAAGWLPPMFGEGYALASDVQLKMNQVQEQMKHEDQKLSSVQGSLLDIRVKAIKEDLRNNEIARCRILLASEKGSKIDQAMQQRALDYVSQAIDAAMDQYYGLTHQVYSAQPCEVLMIGAGGK